MNPEDDAGGKEKLDSLVQKYDELTGEIEATNYISVALRCSLLALTVLSMIARLIERQNFAPNTFELSSFAFLTALAIVNSKIDPTEEPSRLLAVHKAQLRELLAGSLPDRIEAAAKGVHYRDL